MSENQNSERRDIVLRGEFVELNKVLKFENLVMSGGEAKQAIQSGAVAVNGEAESRVRRKLVAGDCVAFAGVELTIVAPSQ